MVQFRAESLRRQYYHYEQQQCSCEGEISMESFDWNSRIIDENKLDVIKAKPKQKLVFYFSPSKN